MYVTRTCFRDDVPVKKEASATSRDCSSYMYNLRSKKRDFRIPDERNSTKRIPGSSGIDARVKGKEVSFK